MVYVLAAVNEESLYGGGIVPVGIVYEIYQHKISIHPSTTKPTKYEARRVVNFTGKLIKVTHFVATVSTQVSPQIIYSTVDTTHTRRFE